MQAPASTLTAVSADTKWSSSSSSLRGGSDAASSASNFKDAEVGKTLADGHASHSAGALRVAVLGQGLMGSAITNRMRACEGIEVVGGSRRAGAGTGAEDEFIPLPVAEAIACSDIIVMAVPAAAHTSVADQHRGALRGKIVIDLSNGTGPHSGAYSRLVQALPGSYVFKAFNTLSAYAFDTNGFADMAPVPVCGDDARGKAVVMQLISSMGLKAVDYGASSKGDVIENMLLTLFSAETHCASLVTLAVFIICYVYASYRYVELKGYEPYQASFFILNKGVCWTAMVLQAFTFFPGTCIELKQLCTGRAYIKLPPWAALCMGSRKALGLWTAWLTTMHAIISAFIFNPAYFAKFFQSDGGELSEQGSLCMMFGVIAGCIFIPMAMASMPSIGAGLSWREFHFIFTYLGWFSLACAFVHTVYTGVNNLFDTSLWPKGQPSVTMLAAVPPALVMAMKLVTLLFYPRLHRIKSGRP